ncbi:MAG: hypothetical protein A2Y25_11685 [Candidatus Melainabacteria bacterium GWF2_37_15]|nr:MAG: hypothetical protein A2Y25_11685 [Candidatus Melainabacteria bacterium GWF2_37_15]
MLYIYNIFLIVFAIILSPVVGLAFIIKPKFRAGFWQKIGFYKQTPHQVRGDKRKSIWVHAVSVGEINATEGLIKRMKQDFPDYNLIVTTVTATGQEIANKKLKNTADVITYFPYDFSFSTKAALKAFNPALIIIAETEIWPGFVNQASKKNIPLMLVNGRISPGSFKGYRKFRFFFKKVLEKFSLILMQTETDKERIIGIGAPLEKVEIMGNLKFDINKTLDENSIKNLQESLKTGNNRVLIAGSTHQGEDETALRVYNRLKCEFDDLKLLIAPRHPERNASVQNLIAKSGYSYGLRSKNDDFNNKDIILLDVMGELGQMYSVSHLAFVGGSFSGTGGHNPLEPAIYEIPVISGPTVFNFRDIYQFMTNSGAAKIVSDEQDMYNQLRKYLVNDNKYSEASRACAEIFEKNRGALDFAVKRIGNYL